jgi:hypothetical protein
MNGHADREDFCCGRNEKLDRLAGLDFLHESRHKIEREGTSPYTIPM